MSGNKGKNSGSKQESTEESAPIFENDLVLNWLIEQADKIGQKHYQGLFGSISYSEDPRMSQNAGAIYGVWVQASASKLALLFSQVKSRNRNLKNIADFHPIPGHETWYPLYWGKDANPGSRLRAHVEGHKNGNINIFQYSALHSDVMILYGVLLVEDYCGFESHLFAKFPPLIGTGKRGKIAAKVRFTP